MAKWWEEEFASTPAAAANKKPKEAWWKDEFADTSEDIARLEAEKAEKQRSEEIAAKNSAEAPLSIPQVPVGMLGTWGGMMRAGEMEQARASARVDDGKGNNVLNVVPQGVGSAAASAAGGAGAFADTLLNAPRAAAEAVLPEEWYRKLYGTAPGVPFDAATRAGADVADALRVTTDAEFPMPQANRRWKAEDAAVKAAGGGLVEEVMTGLRNPVGVAQEALKMGVEFGTVARAAGVLGGTALMEGGATDIAASEFDRQWKEGTVQQSAAYQELAAELGPEAAREALKSKRMQLTAQLGALTGVAGAKVSGKFGGQKIEEFLSGKADEAIPFTQVPLQAAMEGAEEVPVQIGTNIAAQWTGDPERDATAGAGSAFVQGALVGGTTAGGISGIQSGMESARQKLDELRGTSVGKPDVTPPKTKTPSVSTGDIDSNIEGSISSVDIASNTVSNIVDQKKDVTLAEGVPSIAQESAPVNKKLSIAEAGSVIDNRLTSLREASTANRLDDSTVKMLQKEEEELRLTLQEDEQRKAQGILQTPERPYLSDNARALISEKRAELREQLWQERHRLAVGRGNELRDLETKLSKLGESDNEVVSLAESLARDSGGSLATAAAQVAQAPVTRSEPPATAPSTTLPAPVQNAAVAPPAQPQTAPEVAPSVASTTPAPTAPNPAPTNTQSAVAPKAPLKPRDFRLQATKEIQAKVASDPAYRKRVTADTNLFNTDVLARAEELKAASDAKKAAPTPAPAETPSLDLAQPGDTRPAYASKQEFLDELYSGVGDKEATEARKVADNIVVYDGDADLASIDPEVAAAVEEAIVKQGATGAKPRAFEFRGKVYFNTQGVKPGEAKSAFLHEARVHLAAKSEPARISSLAGRVVALAKAGDATAKEAADTVAKEYPGLATAAKEGNESAKDKSREELLADFAQRVYDRVKKGQGVSGTIKRLYSDVISYLRDVYTTAAKKYLGEDYALKITDVDILDAVRYGRTAAGFKGESQPTRSAAARETTTEPSFSTTNPADIKQDQLVTPREKGATGIVNRILDTAIMGLTPRGRASKVTQLATEQQTGIEAEYRLETELATYEMEQAFNEATKTLPQRTKELYRANMMKRLSGDQTVDLPERTKKAVDALRTMIDNRSMLLIALGAVPPKETKKLLRNIGSWLHNDYQKTRMSPAQFLRKVQDWSAGGRDVIAEMLPDLLDSMALPDEAGLDTLLAQTKSKQANLKKERNTAKKILRMYAEQWGLGANTALEGKDGVVDRLKDLTKADPAKVRATAVNYANRLLDPKRTTLDTNPAGVFSRATGAIRSAMNIDDSSLDKKRTKMPKWLQTLYGKYSDPAAVAIISLGEQGRILAKFRALWDFRETGLREGILKENVAGTDAESMGKQGYELLTNHQQLHYGPLENMWIKREDKWLMDMSAAMEFVGFSKDPARYLAGYMHQNTSGPGAAAATIGMGVIAAVQPVGRAFKISQVLVDHTSAITNMGGSAIFLSGGLTAPGSWGPAAAGARFSSFAGTMVGSNARKDQITEDVKFLTRMTVLQNASLSADIRSDLIDRVDQEMEQYLPKARRGYIKTGRGLRRVVDFAARINSAGDEFSKMLMWYARMPHLAAIHPDKTEDEIRELAAEEVLQTTANWHREAPLAKALGNTMVVAPFIVFQAGMVRSSYNSLALVAKYSAMAKDGNAAAGKYAAMEFGHFVLRVAGAAALNTALLKGAQMLAYAFIAAGGGSDEEKEKEVKEWEEGNKLNAPDVYVHARGLLADYQLGDVNFMRKTGEDTYTYASTQRLETLPFANIWSASKRNDTDELVEIGLGYTSEVPTWLPFMTALANTPAAITEGFKESGPSQKAAGKGYWETGKAITPGMFKRVYNQIDTPTEFSPVEKIMNNTLFTVQTLDLKKEAGNLAADYVISVGRAMDNLRDDAKKEEAYEKVGINSVLDYTGTVEKKYTAYVKARKKVLDLRGMGKDEEWIRAQIKTNPINDSLSKPELTSLMNGYFIMPDFDKVLTKKEEQQVKAVTTEVEKQRVRDLFKEYREQLNDQKALFQAFIKRDGEVVR